MEEEALSHLTASIRRAVIRPPLTPPHSSFIDADAKTLLYFWISSWINCLNAAGVVPVAVAPLDARCCFVLSFASALEISELSVDTIAASVLDGARTPYH